jgi:hypothetical protein
MENSSLCTIYTVTVTVILWPTVSRPVCFGIKHSTGAQDQTFVTARQLPVCWCGALSLTRGRVCCLQLLLALASAVILGSESLGTQDNILQPLIWDSSKQEGGPVIPSDTGFTFRRLLRLAGLRWRYSTPPPHEIIHLSFSLFLPNWLTADWSNLHLGTDRVENTILPS